MKELVECVVCEQVVMTNGLATTCTLMKKNQSSNIWMEYHSKTLATKEYPMTQVKKEGHSPAATTSKQVSTQGADNQADIKISWVEKVTGRSAHTLPSERRHNKHVTHLNKKYQICCPMSPSHVICYHPMPTYSVCWQEAHMA